MKYLLFLSLAIFMGCGQQKKTKSSLVQQNVSQLYQASKLQVKVYYESGSEPYTDKLLTLDLWSFLEQNLVALVSERSMQVEVPKALSDMTEITSQQKTTWTTDEVFALAERFPLKNETGTAKFQVFFVNGIFKDNPGVIGFQISGTTVMAIFKDVIRSTSSGQLGFVPRYVEQATMIHEMGHALGLVNNGVPMHSSHQDTAHGAHCSNPDCVMYYQNEGASDLIKYAKSAYGKGSTVMFDKQCLDDTKNFQK